MLGTRICWIWVTQDLNSCCIFNRLLTALYCKSNQWARLPGTAWDGPSRSKSAKLHGIEAFFRDIAIISGSDSQFQSRILICLVQLQPCETHIPQKISQVTSSHTETPQTSESKHGWPNLIERHHKKCVSRRSWLPDVTCWLKTGQKWFNLPSGYD